MYDLIILGAGPAGVSAGVYAGRKKMKTLLITEFFGGQSVAAAEMENWIGTPKISGWELSKKLEEHLRLQESVIVKEGERAVGINKREDYFMVKTEKGEEKARAIIISTGARRRKLNALGEEKFEGKGVVYCSTCDAPLFNNKKVAVIGGGNAGLEAVEDLLPYAEEIYLFVRSDAIKGDLITFEKIKQSSKLKAIIYNAAIVEVKGETFIKQIIYSDLLSGEKIEMAVDGVFVEIGSVPNSEMVKNLIKLNQQGEIVIDHKTGATTTPGIFAAGDVTDAIYKQNNISAGDGVKAALSAYQYILQKK